MPPLSFKDTGVDVYVDVHGCSVSEAMDVIDRTLELASDAGRQRVIVVHGLGGTDAHSSIRQALREAISRGEYDDLIVGSLETSGGGRTDLALRYRRQASKKLLSIADVYG